MLLVLQHTFMEIDEDDIIIVTLIISCLYYMGTSLWLAHFHVNVVSLFLKNITCINMLIILDV